MTTKVSDCGHSLATRLWYTERASLSSVDPEIFTTLWQLCDDCGDSGHRIRASHRVMGVTPLTWWQMWWQQRSSGHPQPPPAEFQAGVGPPLIGCESSVFPESSLLSTGRFRSNQQKAKRSRKTASLSPYFRLKPPQNRLLISPANRCMVRTTILEH